MQVSQPELCVRRKSNEKESSLKEKEDEEAKEEEEEVTTRVPFRWESATVKTRKIHTRQIRAAKK